MKNLMNRVLVVLTVSALFAGNISAQQGKVSAQRAKMAAQRAAQVADVSKLGFFELVNKMGDETFEVWTMEMRKNALISEYGSLDKAPRNLKLFLLGDDKNKTTEYRAKFKVAALKEIATKGIVEQTKTVKEIVAQQETNPTTEGQAQLSEETSILTSMTNTFNSYVPASAITSAKAAIGSAVVIGLVYGGTFALDMAVAGGYGAAFRAYVSNNASLIKEYVTSSRPAQYLGRGAAAAKGYAGRAVSGAKHYGRAAYNAAAAAPGVAMTAGSTAYHAAKNRIYGPSAADLQAAAKAAQDAANMAARDAAMARAVDKSGRDD